MKNLNPDVRSLRILGHRSKALSSQARRVLSHSLPLLLLAAATAAAQDNFAFDPFTIDGGGGTSTGSSYSISGTAGQPDAGQMSGGSYVIRGGLWHAFAAARQVSFPLQLAILPGRPMQLLLICPTNRTVNILASDRLGAQANWSVIATTNSSVTSCVVCSLAPTATPRFFRAMLVEANRPPVLQLIGSRQVAPGQALSFTAVAQDSDAGQALTFRLDPGSPGGASINAASGAFSWTPSMVGDYPITVRVTDNGDPPLSAAETITITVAVQTNRQPVLGAIGNKAVAEETTLTFTASATDPDAEQTLTFSLGASYPPGATITSGGAFDWTPTEAQGPGSYPITVIVTDNGTPPQSDSETITLTVNEVNKAPLLSSIPDKSVGVNQTLVFNAAATDPDLPAQTLTFSLVNPPTGATISTGGAFNWTPTAAGSYPMTVEVTDSGVPLLSSSNTFTLTVTNVNHAPVLNPIGSRYVNAGYELTIDATATDQDVGQGLTFSVGLGAPAGAAIVPNTGHFSWTPPSGGTNFIVVRVTDNGSPPASDEETITIYVSDKRPTLTGPATTDSGAFTLQWTYAWSGLGSNADGYELQESTTSSNEGFVAIFSTYNQSDRESPRTYPATGKTSGTYWYRVRAHNAQWSTWSDVLQVQVTLASQLEFLASKDNMMVYSIMDSSYQNNVYRNNELAVGNHWEWWGYQDVLAYESALWFDVQSQVVGRQIRRATLRLWPYSLPLDWNTWYEASAFATTWNANTITFAHQPNTYALGVAVANPPFSTAVPVEWDVTAIMQNWANGTWTNNGFHLSDGAWVFPSGTYYRDTQFESMDYYFSLDHRPKLIIEFQ